jgi:hypothetical protein
MPILAMGLLLVGGTMLLAHVPNVVFLGAKKEVARVHATRVIAFVTDNLAAYGDMTKGDCVGDAMRQVPGLFPDSKAAVVAGDSMTKPRPALIVSASVHFAPKPTYNLFGQSHLPNLSHRHRRATTNRRMEREQ